MTDKAPKLLFDALGAIGSAQEFIADCSLAGRSDQWSQFEARCLQSSARLDGWKFERDEANAR